MQWEDGEILGRYESLFAVLMLDALRNAQRLHRALARGQALSEHQQAELRQDEQFLREVAPSWWPRMQPLLAPVRTTRRSKDDRINPWRRPRKSRMDLPSSIQSERDAKRVRARRKIFLEGQAQGRED